MPEPWPSAVAIATKMERKYESAGAYYIPPKLIQAGGDILHSEILKFINSIWNKE
jgi:hypothetical protein